MRRLANILAATALACALSTPLAPCALAAPGDAGASDIGSLSSRFSMLDDLADSRTPDENVVIETHIGVLTGANQALDNSSVRFEGEAVGEAVSAGPGLKWVSVNDDSGQGIAVLMTDEQLQAVESYGNYQQTGSVIEVTGIYHVACVEHQGELDVHANSVVLVEAGEKTEHAVGEGKIVAAVVMVIFGLSFMACYFLLNRASKKKGDR